MTTSEPQTESPSPEGRRLGFAGIGENSAHPTEEIPWGAAPVREWPDHSDDPRAVFAYGSLRVGESNHNVWLQGRFIRMTRARLPDYAAFLGPSGYLVAWPAAGQKLEGELFDLVVESAANTLQRLDQLEEIPPGSTRGTDYERQLCVVETADGPRRAWVYTGPRGNPET